MNFVIELVSSPDRDELVAEIWWCDQMVAEIHRSADGSSCIELYSKPSQAPWLFRFDEWLAALEEGESRLRGV